MKIILWNRNIISIVVCIYVYKDGRENERMEGRMKGLKGEWTDWRKNERMTGRMKGWKGEWKDEMENERMKGRMSEWKGVRIYGR